MLSGAWSKNQIQFYLVVPQSCKQLSHLKLESKETQLKLDLRKSMVRIEFFCLGLEFICSSPIDLVRLNCYKLNNYSFLTKCRQIDAKVASFDKSRRNAKFEELEYLLIES